LSHPHGKLEYSRGYLLEPPLTVNYMSWLKSSESKL